MAVFATCLGAFGDLPDLIASGINPGANTGHLVLHSGTVGATLTGAGLRHPRRSRCRSTGASRRRVPLGRRRRGWPRAAVEWAAKPDGDARVLNLNVPNLPLAEIKGVREAELAPAGEVWVASADVSEGDLRIEITGRADAAPGTDVALVNDGYVSVTPLMSIVRGPARGAADAIVDALGDAPIERRTPPDQHVRTRKQEAHMVAVGDVAPDFTLKDQNGNDVTLSVVPRQQPRRDRLLPVHVHRRRARASCARSATTRRSSSAAARRCSRSRATRATRSALGRAAGLHVPGAERLLAPR